MAIEIVDLPIKNGDGLIIISYLGVAKMAYIQQFMAISMIYGDNDYWLVVQT